MSGHFNETVLPGLVGRYPDSILAERHRAALSADLRDRARFDIHERPYYLFGLLTAADVARFCGLKRLVAIEFGVAEGHGFRVLKQHALAVEAETGVAIDLVGFDTGQGLPALSDHRDHPEIWQAGDFPNRDRAALSNVGRMVWGDIADTISGFVREVSADAPIGFVSCDVDIYSSTMSSLRLFSEAEPRQLLPVVPCYFDDTIGGPGRMGSLFRNRWCGQLLAIDEFNGREPPLRRLDEIRTLRYRRPLNAEPWLAQIYALHVLDHPDRQVTDRRNPVSSHEHAAIAGFSWPL